MTGNFRPSIDLAALEAEIAHVRSLDFDELRSCGATFRAFPPPAFSTALIRRLYRNRNAVERMFCRLKDFRRIATRYDKLPQNDP